MVLLLRTNDLMSRVRLASHWKKAGHTVLNAPGDNALDMIVLDLTGSRGEAQIREDRAAFPQTPIVAFGPHVDDETLKNARSAGADHAVARGGVLEKVLRLLAKRDDTSA